MKLLYIIMLIAGFLLGYCCELTTNEFIVERWIIVSLLFTLGWIVTVLLIGDMNE